MDGSHSENESNVEYQNCAQHDANVTICPIQPIKESRSKMNDLIITCTDEDRENEKKIFMQFGVEKSLLACHSTIVSDMIDCCPDPKEKVQNNFTEHPDIVLTFLNLIYGQLDCVELAWSFDHCIDVIEMGFKYGVNSVVDQGLHQLCRTMKSNNCSFYVCPPRMGKAFIIEFFRIWRKAIRSEFILDYPLKALSESCEEIWNECLGACEIYAPVRGNLLKCEGCKKDSELYNSTIDRTLITINTFLSPSQRHLFCSEDLLDLQMAFTDYATSNEEFVVIIHKRFLNPEVEV